MLIFSKIFLLFCVCNKGVERYEHESVTLFSFRCLTFNALYNYCVHCNLDNIYLQSSWFSMSVFIQHTFFLLRLCKNNEGSYVLSISFYMMSTGKSVNWKDIHRHADVNCSPSTGREIQQRSLLMLLQTIPLKCINPAFLFVL